MSIDYIYMAICPMGGTNRILTTKVIFLATQLIYEIFLFTDSLCKLDTLVVLATKDADRRTDKLEAMTCGPPFFS